MKTNPIKRNMEDGSSFEELIAVLIAEPDSQCTKPLNPGAGNGSQGSGDGMEKSNERGKW
jgi:hypothetical protein